MTTSAARPTRRVSTTDAASSRRGARRSWLIAAIVGTAAIALLSIQKTAGTVFARRAPEMALRIDPTNAVALATSADRLLIADPIRNAAAAGRVAVRSLRRQGLNAVAARNLGFVFDTQRKPVPAAALMELSARMSRRDSGTQMWLIERAVGAGDIAGALRHYDVALRTTKTADLLFPILTDALDDRPVREAFVPYVSGRPFWIEMFLAFAISQSDHPENVAALMLDARGTLADPRNHDLALRLTERLLAGGSIDLARQVYLASSGGSSARLISAAIDPRDRTGRDGAIGWRVSTAQTVQATIDAGAHASDAVLHVETSADGSGRVAEKVLFLPPASYRFLARATATPPESAATIRWTLDCVATGDRRTIWTRDSGIGDVVVPFMIDTRCAMQKLFIDVVADDESRDRSLDITLVAIRAG